MASALRRLFLEGFRAFFLFAGIFAILAGLVWFVWLGVHYLGGMVTDMPFEMAPHMWHAHEMIFGYSAFALGGFLLTAVPNWTGAKSAPHVFIAASVGVLIAGRVAMWASGALPAGLVAVIDLAFLPILGAKILSQLLKRPKPQNMMFLLFLSLIWISNLMVHLEWMGLTSDSAETGLRAGLLATCSMIAVLGGRVTPAFTRNAMKRAEMPEQTWPKSVPLLEKTSLVVVILLPISVLLGMGAILPGVLAVLAGALQLTRLLRWCWRWTLDKPILLALHLGMGMLGLGLLLWGGAQLGLGSEVAALHVLGVGAVGGMTMAVMSRAILGHTGRPLVASGPVTLGYYLVALAAVTRYLASAWASELYFPLVLLSGFLWCLAFMLFVLSTWPLVTTARADPPA